MHRRRSLLSFLPIPLVLPVVAALLVLAAAPFATAQERMSMIPAERQTDAQKKAVADYKAKHDQAASTAPALQAAD